MKVFKMKFLLFLLVAFLGAFLLFEHEVYHVIGYTPESYRSDPVHVAFCEREKYAFPKYYIGGLPKFKTSGKPLFVELKAFLPDLSHRTLNKEESRDPDALVRIYVSGLCDERLEDSATEKNSTEYKDLVLQRKTTGVHGSPIYQESSKLDQNIFEYVPVRKDLKRRNLYVFRNENQEIDFFLECFTQKERTFPTCQGAYNDGAVTATYIYNKKYFSDARDYHKKIIKFLKSFKIERAQ